MSIALYLRPLTAFDARASIHPHHFDELTEERLVDETEPPDFNREVLVHVAILRKAARRTCRSDADAEDAVQDTIERALRKFAGLSDRSNIRGWLLTILANVLTDRFRREKIVKLVQLGPQHEEAPFESLAPPKHKLVEWHELQAVLEKLKPHLRAVIELRAQGIAYAEIAARLK